jgi:5-oxoprolinase (ATP-hydrolysing) subunit A
MSRTIDLNADLGEFDEPAALARDRAIMAQISSANIACGGHAGNDRTMAEMLEASAAAGVAAGAHPSYPDRENFGRTSMTMAEDALTATLTEQILVLKRLADARGLALTHVKPHGQLYNDAADDARLAALIGGVIKAALPGAAYVGLAGSEMGTAARAAGLTFIAEGFADRRYDARGRLVSRKEKGAVLESEAERIEQALDLARGDPIHSKEGGLIDLAVDSICLHSDSEGALASARDIRAALNKAGIKVAARR